MVTALQFVEAEGLPAGFRAVSTTRHGGVSVAPFDSFNLATHVGDDLQHVSVNRHILREALALPAQPCWLNQVHGIAVVDADQSYAEPPAADASYSRAGEAVCAVLTADCLPVVFASASGEMACAHAGWRGLLNGVLLETLARFSAQPAAIHAWFGPAIGPASFEVGAEVRELFLQQWSHLPVAELEACFVASGTGKYVGDLFRLARLQLADAGVIVISGGGIDTLQLSARFYSYRAQAQTGRIATLVWRTNTQ